MCPAETGEGIMLTFLARDGRVATGKFWRDGNAGPFCTVKTGP